MKKHALLAAAAALGVGTSIARADFQFNLLYSPIPSTSTSMFHGDDQWTLQVLNAGNTNGNNTGTNLVVASVTMLSLTSTGTVNQSGTFFVRTFNGTSYDTVTPANNNQADFQNLGAAGRPDIAGSYVNFAGGWAGASTPDQTSQTFTDGQAVGWSSTVPTTSPQSGTTMGGSFNVVGTTASNNVGVPDTSFTTLAHAVVPHGQLTAFDVSLAGDQGNPTSKLILAFLGDANFDYTVNSVDLSFLLSHYNSTSGNTWSNGDFNGDGAVNSADLSFLLSNYNKTITPTPPPAAMMAVLDASALAVPEPTSIGLLGAALGAMAIRRRRNA